MCVTNGQGLQVCGSTKYCCPGEQAKHEKIKRFEMIANEIINSQSIVQADCGENHSVVLTDAGHLLSWGGSASEDMSRRPSMLYK